MYIPAHISKLLIILTITIHNMLCKVYNFPTSQSTVVLCDMGMDEVFQHHAHTFEKSDLNFHFQYEFSSVTAEW